MSHPTCMFNPFWVRASTNSVTFVFYHILLENEYEIRYFSLVWIFSHPLITLLVIFRVKTEIGFLIISAAVYDINFGFKLTSISFNRDLEYKLFLPWRTINFGFKFDFCRCRDLE